MANWIENGSVFVKNIVNVKDYTISAYKTENYFEIYYNFTGITSLKDRYSIFALDYTLPILYNEEHPSHGFEYNTDEIVRLDYYSPSKKVFCYNGGVYHNRECYVRDLMKYFFKHNLNNNKSFLFAFATFNAKQSVTNRYDRLCDLIIGEVKSDVMELYNQIINDYEKYNEQKEGLHYLKWHVDKATHNIFPQMEGNGFEDYTDNQIDYIVETYGFH